MDRPNVRLSNNWKFKYVPYVPPSSVRFQIGIWSPKQHLFDRQFCVGLVHIFCKQGPKGRGKIFIFWPLHSVRQNVAGFWRGLFTCFLGHTSLLPAFWATPQFQVYHKQNSMQEITENLLLFCLKKTRFEQECYRCSKSCAFWATSHSGTPCCWTPLLTVKLQSAVQVLALYNCYIGVWPKKQVIREYGPKSR